MADRKISDLTALTTPATGDLIPIVDVSEAAAADKNKSITVGELLRGAPDGTAAAPGFAFESDGGNGMFLGGTDILAFSTGGTQAVTIDASQRLGVGTTSPGNPLEVVGAIETSGSSNAVLFAGSSSTPTIGAGIHKPADDSLAIVTGSTERLRIDSSGRVGIGTSSPQSLLHLSNTSQIRNQCTSTTNAISFWKDGTPSFAAEVGCGSATGIASALKFDIYNGSSWNTAVNIDSSSRVGIGTTSPGVKLHVNEGSTSAVSMILSNSEGTYQLSANNNVALHYTSQHIFNNAAGTAEYARIDSSGRLLIGTSSASGDFGTVVNAGGTARVLLARESLPTSSGGLGSLGWGRTNGEVGATIGGVADANWTSGSSYPTRLVFSTTQDGDSSPTERMRISANGQIDTFWHSQYGLVVNSSKAAGTGDFLIYGRYSATNTLGSGGGNSFRVSTNGNVTNTNNSYGAISDIKLKENIVDASSQWDDLKSIQVRNYNFKEGQTHTQIGVVAQEVELVSPGLVTESPDTDAEGNDLGTVTKSVNYSVLYMKAVKALQEAMERIETLEAKVAALEAN